MEKLENEEKYREKIMALEEGIGMGDDEKVKVLREKVE